VAIIEDLRDGAPAGELGEDLLLIGGRRGTACLDLFQQLDGVEVGTGAGLGAGRQDVSVVGNAEIEP
jgi:aerobic-type carbon monoxide dehydrogenase small subunit (CoxS/CutS family)